MYEETDQYSWTEDPQLPPPNIISTSQAINLTCTLASLSTLFALFLCFADQRSRAVRRFAVQSVGLGALHIAAGMAFWILSAVFGAIPWIGFWFFLLFLIAFILASGLAVVLRVRMMLYAYRGEAYALPYIGEKLRVFE